MDSTWDCVVVGGGAAGLSAALVLGRARRRTLVVDAGGQSNLAAHAMGGLIGQDGRPPADFYADGRAELAAYPSVEVRAGEVTGGTVHDGAVVLELAGGGREAARHVLLATGVDYRYPDVPGAAERWGGSVFHCPFCHGWEVRGGALGVLGGGEEAGHRAQLLRMWSDDVTVFANGDAVPSLDPGIMVDARPVARLRGEGDALESVVFEDGAQRRCDGLLVAVTLHQRSALAQQLGVAVADGPMGAMIEADAWGRTSVPCVSAAGDASVQPPSLVNAIASGSTAAAGVVQRLSVQ
jgi:thioredoxin reductase